MKKSKGFIDPFSLGFIVALGIATTGTMMGKDVVDRGEMAQGGQDQTELVVPAKKAAKSVIGA